MKRKRKAAGIIAKPLFLSSGIERAGLELATPLKIIAGLAARSKQLIQTTRALRQMGRQ